MTEITLVISVIMDEAYIHNKGPAPSSENEVGKIKNAIGSDREARSAPEVESTKGAG